MATVTIMNATVADDLDFDPVVTKVVFGGYNESLTLEAIEAIELPAFHSSAMMT